MKNRILLLSLFSIISYFGYAQEFTANEVLNKAIAHHDPNKSWEQFNDTLFIDMTTPDKNVRSSIVEINLPESFFKLTSQKDEDVVAMQIIQDSCAFTLNGSAEVSAEKMKALRISCERTKMMKDYYTYLYGLPMKLKDPGTILDETVYKKVFKNKEYLVLKATYDPKVGSDVWYFYFDPKTYALEVYQFYHDETKNDGEYILLSDVAVVSGIKMPKSRSWYYNKDDKFLGVDVLNNKKQP